MNNLGSILMLDREVRHMENLLFLPILPGSKPNSPYLIIQPLQSLPFIYTKLKDQPFLNIECNNTSSCHNQFRFVIVVFNGMSFYHDVQLYKFFVQSMEEILHHLECTKPCRQSDVYLISTGAGFLPSTVSSSCYSY